MELTFKGVDISTEEKFVSYINSLNTAIMKQNAMNEIKQDLYDVSYLKKRYRKIVAKNEKALFMADHECLKCVYFQRLARKCQANCKCPLEESTEGGVPHREFQDLSIVYKVIISADKDAVQSSKITNEFAKRLGMSEEQLFKCAAENTRRLFPPVVRSMNDIMKEMFARDGMPQEIAEMMIAEIPPEQTMWVISNEKGINGAASMLYENELHELAESLESDLYILPSSVHEVIAVSSDMGSPEMLAQMVVEVNMQEVSLDERLSNQVYHYDKDLRKLTLATDTPNKRLDGIVAEPPLVYDAKEKSR